MYVRTHVLGVLDGSQGEQRDEAGHLEDLAIAHDLELLARRDVHRAEEPEPRHVRVGLGREHRETCFLGRSASSYLSTAVLCLFFFFFLLCLHLYYIYAYVYNIGFVYPTPWQDMIARLPNLPPRDIMKQLRSITKHGPLIAMKKKNKVSPSSRWFRTSSSYTEHDSWIRRFAPVALAPPLNCCG